METRSAASDTIRARTGSRRRREVLECGHACEGMLKLTIPVVAGVQKRGRLDGRGRRGRGAFVPKNSGDRESVYLARGAEVPAEAADGAGRIPTTTGTSPVPGL